MYILYLGTQSFDKIWRPFKFLRFVVLGRFGLYNTKQLLGKKPLQIQIGLIEFFKQNLCSMASVASIDHQSRMFDGGGATKVCRASSRTSEAKLPAQGSGRGGLLIKQIAIHFVSTPVLDLRPFPNLFPTKNWGEQGGVETLGEQKFITV